MFSAGFTRSEAGKPLATGQSGELALALAEAQAVHALEIKDMAAPGRLDASLG